MIGSEGTLGMITKVSILTPQRPKVGIVFRPLCFTCNSLVEGTESRNCEQS